MAVFYFVIFPTQFKNMAKVIEATYERGVFKPLEKVDLKDGESENNDMQKREDIKGIIKNS